MGAVLLELGQLKGSTKSLEQWVAAIAGDVDEIKQGAAERKAAVDRVLEKLGEIGTAVAHLNDVDAKLLEVGLRLDDAKGHRQDQITLRRVRKFLEVAWRYAVKTLVALGVVAAVGLIARIFPPAWSFVGPVLEHVLE